MEQILEIFPINSKPLGISYREWSIKWWQWLASIPIDMNPAFDERGEYVNVNQNITNVTFLCQTIEGSKRTPIRQSIISTGQFFFMPIINWISIEGEDGVTDAEMITTARDKMNVINKLELIINGLDMSFGLIDNRVNSTFFIIDLPKNNIFGLEEGQKRCMSDGYWVFFRSFSDNLAISTESACSAGITKISVEYSLKIIKSLT